MGGTSPECSIRCLRQDTGPEPVTVSLRVDGDFAPEFVQGRDLTFELAGRREAYFDPAKARAGVVTCGGLCPGINDVVRQVVRTLCGDYGLGPVLGIRHGLRGLIPENGLEAQELTPERVADVHESGGSFLGTSRGPQDPEAIIRQLERLGLSVLFVVGGDGSMRAAHALDSLADMQQRRLSIIGIPKTIDNDIPCVPQSFGFATAVDRTVNALRCAHVEARSVQGGIGLVRIMGRESGFLAAHAALAFRDADFVLVPEAAFDPDTLVEAVAHRLARFGHALLAVAEGAGQEHLERPYDTDLSGNRDLGDVCGFLVRFIGCSLRRKGIAHQFKFIDPSYTVRSVPAGSADRLYCALLGEYAAHAAMSGRTGMAVVRVADKFVHMPLSLLSRGRRKMGPDSALWQAVLACTGQGDLSVCHGPGGGMRASIQPRAGGSVQP